MMIMTLAVGMTMIIIIAVANKVANIKWIIHADDNNDNISISSACVREKFIWLIKERQAMSVNES